MQRNSCAFKKIAHRGASQEAPENTIVAFQLAFQKYHCDMVEMDIRLTRDGVPVVIHDQTLERTTNGQGPVNQYPLSEIKKLDAGYWFEPFERKEFPYRGRGVTLPTLEEVLRAFPNEQLCLELKDKTGEIAKKAVEVLNKDANKKRFIVGSFVGGVVRKLRRISKNSFETFLAEDEVILAYLAFRLGFKKFPLPASHASLPRNKYKIRLDEKPWIAFLQRQGALVYFWTVNEAAEMKELAERGADGILTDYPDRFRN